MRIKLLLLALTVLASSFSVNAQGTTGNAWEFNCVKFEEGAHTQCGPSAFEWQRTHLLPTTHMTLVGRFTAVNRSDRFQKLEILEVSPAQRRDDPLQTHWITTRKSDMTAMPGQKSTMQVHFISGARKENRLSPGTYDATIKLRDVATGQIHTISITIHAIDPTKKK